MLSRNVKYAIARAKAGTRLHSAIHWYFIKLVGNMSSNAGFILSIKIEKSCNSHEPRLQRVNLKSKNQRN